MLVQFSAEGSTTPGSALLVSLQLDGDPNAGSPPSVKFANDEIHPSVHSVIFHLPDVEPGKHVLKMLYRVLLPEGTPSGTGTLDRITTVVHYSR